MTIDWWPGAPRDQSLTECLDDLRKKRAEHPARETIERRLRLLGVSPDTVDADILVLALTARQNGGSIENQLPLPREGALRDRFGDSVTIRDLLAHFGLSLDRQACWRDARGVAVAPDGPDMRRFAELEKKL